MILRVFRSFNRLAAAAIILLGALGAKSSRASPPGSPWNADYFPKIRLTDQNGKSLRFHEDVVRGKTVLLHFFYTHCREMCPAETANLKRVAELLGDSMGRDVHFYSISIDPVFDSPAELRAYAGKFRIGKGWTFLTGDRDEINGLRKKLGLYRENEKLGDHTTNIVVANEAMGKWIRRSAFDRPATLANLLATRLQQRRIATRAAISYASARRIPAFSHGEELFRSRCESCHRLDAQDGIGPGLGGVTRRRDRAWLAKWILDPDSMLDSGDPAAVALLKRFNGLRMPRLGLNAGEAESLVAFLEERDRAPGGAAAGAPKADAPPRPF